MNIRLPKCVTKIMARIKRNKKIAIKKQAGTEAIANNPYFEEGIPKLTYSICCFLDVLGFSAQIMNPGKSRTGNELLNDFYTANNDALGVPNGFSKEGVLYSKTFSDNLFLAKPFNSIEDGKFTRANNGEEEFATMMYAITNYQLEMALKGFFTRGGLTIGWLFLDDRSIFGSALIEAYELESKKALNPIVLCSAALKTQLDNQIQEYSGDESPPHTNCLYVQEDGSYFLNYLSAAAQGDIIEHEKILLHKTLIEQEIIKNKSNPSVLSKYTWLAGYHNYFCELNSHLPGYSEDLIIQNYPSKYGNLLRK